MPNASLAENAVEKLPSTPRKTGTRKRAGVQRDTALLGGPRVLERKGSGSRCEGPAKPGAAGDEEGLQGAG